MLAAVTVFGEDIRGVELLVLIAAIALLLSQLSTIWHKGVVPLWHFITGTVDVFEVQPTLVTIARQFRPNEGHSLRDVIDRIETELAETSRAVEEQADDIAEIRNLLETFIIQRQEGGRRSTDPHVDS